MVIEQNLNANHPRKVREYRDHHTDSSRWNDFKFRDDDIVIATWAKSGTTWMQQIVGQLLFDGDENIPIMDVCPWLDRRGVPVEKVYAILEQQPHRRFLKTHLPVDALVMSPTAKYIFIGRDGRDALWSWFNHHHGYTDAVYDVLNNAPGLVGPPLEKPGDDIVAYFHEWLDRDGFPVWPFFSNIQSWWDIRSQANVLVVHFNDLKADLAGSMRRVAAFLDIDVAEHRWPDLVHHCTFDYMRANADRMMPHMQKSMRGGARQFIFKGSNERWRDVLTDADIKKYERVANSKLSEDCAHWLATGEFSASR